MKRNYSDKGDVTEPRHNCGGGNNRQWQECTTCGKRIHRIGCTSKLNPKKDCDLKCSDREDRERKLTSKQQELLIYLSKQPNQCMSCGYMHHKTVEGLVARGLIELSSDHPDMWLWDKSMTLTEKGKKYVVTSTAKPEQPSPTGSQGSLQP